MSHIWEKLRTSFWFVPGGMVMVFGAIAFLSLAIDDHWGKSVLDWMPALKNVSASGVRSLLSTAGTAVLALAGVTFSGTLVALTLASGQYGSRLLRNFIRALPNQLALGVQLGTFVMCLIVLRSVRDFGEGSFIPHISAFIAFIATVSSLAVFIFFIHHISTSLEAERVVGSVYHELDESIDRLFPTGKSARGEEAEAEAERDTWDAPDDEFVIRSNLTGYLQAIDVAGLVELVVEQGPGVRGRVLAHAGKFVVEGEALLAIEGGQPERTGPWLECYIIGIKRTPEQDFEYHVRQLVETALRALSPGINDPFTAMHCIDYLGAALSKVASRRLPDSVHEDAEGIARIQTRPVSFNSVMGTAFNQLRHTAIDMPDVSMRILEAFANVASACDCLESRSSVETHTQLVASILEKDGLADIDAESIQERLDRIQTSFRV
ncbi:MAG: DUF2254 domain-containing protein [Verrucomicrobiae bacterium]|nr:DUF2254 domain-containing protein [Verrucomicrobiae bacterium]